MSDDRRPVLDGQVLDWAVQAVRSTGRFTNGVWRDAAWRYAPWRAWISKGSRAFSIGGDSLHRVSRQIDIEMCFPITVPPIDRGPSDLEPLGDIILAEAEWAIFHTPQPFQFEDVTIVADDVLPVTKPNEQTGASLARAVVVLGVVYDRNWGDPYSLGAAR